ncbi:MAG TPA: hypothetical protein VMZ92_21540, partial [Planctomycetota bacterium]|nr:hypothetical protein [Planctomycetota bacterium]
RNLSAAMLVAAQNFSEDAQVLGMVMVIGVLGLILLGVVSGEMGKRVGNRAPASSPGSGKPATSSASGGAS